MSATEGSGAHAGEPAAMTAEQQAAYEREVYEYSGKAAVADLTTTFAAILLIVIAGLEILQGIAAIANDSIYVKTPDYVFEFDVTVWGWIHVILGIVAVFVAIGILRTQSWALIGGVVIAVLSTFANFASIPHYPWWSLTVIAFNALLIWALCTRRARPY